MVLLKLGRIVLLSLATIVPSLPAMASGPCPLEVESGWVRAAPPGMPMLAGYVVLHNPTDYPITVNAVLSEDFDAVEMHRTEQRNGVMRMRELDEVVIAPGGRHHFKPGGDHLMLMQPVRAVGVGDIVNLRVCCGDQPVPVTLPVRRD